MTRIIDNANAKVSSGGHKGHLVTHSDIRGRVTIQEVVIIIVIFRPQVYESTLEILTSSPSGPTPCWSTETTDQWRRCHHVLESLEFVIYSQVLQEVHVDQVLPENMMERKTNISFWKWRFCPFKKNWDPGGGTLGPFKPTGPASPGGPSGPYTDVKQSQKWSTVDSSKDWIISFTLELGSVSTMLDVGLN